MNAKIGNFKSKRWGDVYAYRGVYLRENGPVAVKLATETGEPLATLSVNMYKPECSHDSQDLPADCFYVKTWAENETIANDALASGLFIERTDLPVARSGYVESPVWQIKT